MPCPKEGVEEGERVVPALPLRAPLEVPPGFLWLLEGVVSGDRVMEGEVEGDMVVEGEAGGEGEGVSEGEEERVGSKGEGVALKVAAEEALPCC